MHYAGGRNSVEHGLPSFGGLLSVNQLFCCCPATSHRRLSQCYPCAQKTCIVSATFAYIYIYIKVAYNIHNLCLQIVFRNN